jgi:hypothetical protein
MPPRKQPL